MASLTPLIASVVAGTAGLVGAWIGVCAAQRRENLAYTRSKEERWESLQHENILEQDQRNYERERGAAERIIDGFALHNMGPRAAAGKAKDEDILELLLLIKKERVYFKDRELRRNLTDACSILEHSLSEPLIEGYTIAMTRWILRRNVSAWLSRVIREEAPSVHEPSAAWTALAAAMMKRRAENQRILISMGIPEHEFAPDDEFY